MLLSYLSIAYIVSGFVLFGALELLWLLARSCWRADDAIDEMLRL